jgi:hypothetical protein
LAPFASRSAVTWFMYIIKQSLCRGPEGSRRLRLPHFKTSGRHMKVVRSDLRNGRLYPPGNIAGTHCC